MSFSSFFGLQSSNSAATVTPPTKRKSSSIHSKKPSSLKVQVPEKLPKHQTKTYLPPTENCASPLGTFGSSFLLRTSDLYNIVNIIDGDHKNNGTSTNHKNSTSRTSLMKTRLIQQCNNLNELSYPLSPIYSDMKSRRNLDFDMSNSPKNSPSSPLPSDDEEIYIPKVLSSVDQQNFFDTQPENSSIGGGRNSHDSGVDMSLNEKFDDSNVNNRENVTSREISLGKNISTASRSISPRSFILPIRSNSSLHKSSLYGPNGIPPLFTSSVNDYIGDSVFSGSDKIQNCVYSEQ